METENQQYIQAVTLRNGKQYAERTRNTEIDRSRAEIDRSPGRIQDNLEIDEDRPILDEIDRSNDPQPKVLTGNQASEPQNEEAPKGNGQHEPPPPYVPKLPYPSRKRSKMQEREYEKMKNIVSELQVRLPFVEAVKMVPTLKKFMKDILTNKLDAEKGPVTLTHEVSAILLNESPEKRGDPGSFTLPCEIGNTRFDHCLCDLGASVSLMPLSVAQKLGMNKLKPCRISLILADRSVRRPEGFLENVSVQVGGCSILTDFIVLKLEEEPRDPIILGRPFLATAGAIINVRKGEIDLHLNDLVMNFDLDNMMKKPKLDDQSFWVDTVDEITQEIMQEMHSQDPLEVALCKVEDEFGYCRAETTGFARILDSAETTKSVSFANLDDTGQESSISAKYANERYVQRSINQVPESMEFSLQSSSPGEFQSKAPDNVDLRKGKDMTRPPTGEQTRTPKYVPPGRRKFGKQDASETPFPVKSLCSEYSSFKRTKHESQAIRCPDEDDPGPQKHPH